jgi:acetyl esterase/lipase
MPKGRVMRKLLAAGVLLWTAFGLFLALMIVLPAPTLILWFVAALVEEASLLLTAFALVGILLAVLVRRADAHKTSLVAAGLGAATVVLSLVPVVQALRTASTEGVALSLPAYFARPAVSANRSPETVIYARPGEAGDALKLDVWHPPERGDDAGHSERRPAIVVVHGGGWEWGNRSETPRWNEWLTEQGYVVFDIDYRLAPPPRWKDAPGDVKCAVGWVKENAEGYGVDPDRVALMGYSSGAHLSLLAAYTEGNPELPPSCDVEDTGVAAVAAFSPPTDLTRLYTMEWPPWKPDIVGLRGLRRFLGGTPGSVPERYRTASPITHVDADDPPTFLVHGEGDQIVPFEESELLAERLEEASVSRRFVELSGVNHAFELFWWGGWSSQITRSVLDEFLERHLVARDEASSLSEPEEQDP